MMVNRDLAIRSVFFILLFAGLTGRSGAEKYVVNFEEIPNNGINSFTVNGHPAEGGAVGPCLTRDGLKMFYLRQNDDSECYNTGENICRYANLGCCEGDIWVAERADADPATPWQNAAMLPKCDSGCVNSPTYEISVSVSRWNDATYLYFCSMRSGSGYPGYRSHLAKYNHISGAYHLLGRSDFSNIDSSLPFQSIVGMKVNDTGEYLFYVGQVLLDNEYWYSTCDEWEVGEDRCVLWSNPIAIDALNDQSDTTEPVLRYLLDTPGWSYLGSLAPNWDPENNLYYSFSAMFYSPFPIIAGDYLVFLENNGPGINFGSNLPEIVHGDLNGVINYETKIMMKPDKGKFGTGFDDGWYLETPSIWEDPGNNRRFIYSHVDAKIWFGEIVESAVACMDDIDCEDGNYCNGYETCATNICQAGTPPCPSDECEEGRDECEGYASAANAEASAHGSGSLAGSGIMNQLALIAIPASAVILLKIMRRKK